MPSPDLFAELGALSNFTFLEGASHPREIVATAKALGMPAIGIADRNSVAGLVRGMVAAEQAGIRFVPGIRLCLEDGAEYLAWPTDRTAWGQLCRMLSAARMSGEKGETRLTREMLITHAEGSVLARLPPAQVTPEFARALRGDAAALRHRTALPLFCAVDHRCRGDDQARLDTLAAIGLPLIAAGGVRYHDASRRRVADVLAAIRLGRRVEELGYDAEPNAEAQLLAPEEVARRLPRHPEALAATLRVVEACRFSLRDLSYEYPDEILDPGLTPQQTLEARIAVACAERWPAGTPPKVARQIAHELRLIAQLDYAAYFLTVHEIVRFAQSRHILCQGRGSAANSAVCYVLGITAVAPDKHDLLFERFISAARDEPPDIDVDFEHERREEVIQHIYARYGRDRAALTATLIRFRERSAIREVGKAMGLTEDVTARIAKSVWGAGEKTLEELAAETGFDPVADPRIRLAMEIAEEIQDFPRHLATHVGGFVITRGPLTEHTVVVKAAMDGRSTIEWDKDDIEALRILKVDVLGLGMLTCIRRAFALIEGAGGPRLALHTVPQDDPATYAMLARADSIGVFQVESRAQMNMLPRLRPREFYDLVIQVAIVRPGPIQGDMVHPYLKRRRGAEPVRIPAPAPEHGPPDELTSILGRTLGVPIFQEQAMKIALDAAKFSSLEANRLRKAMATFRSRGMVDELQDMMVERMVARGYDRDFAQRCFNQIRGFGEYGFPESHAASFAQLVYVSSWLKCHYPAAFACALLNSQPMGFYAPAQIVRDAREHGVAVLPVDVNASLWDCTLEGGALRLGLRQIDGLPEHVAATLVSARQAGGPYRDIADLRARAGLSPAHIERLASADAFTSLGLTRRQALWDARSLIPAPDLPLFRAAAVREEGAERARIALPAMPLSEEVVADYQTTRLSLKAHPMAFLRADLAQRGFVRACDLRARKFRSMVQVAGVVLIRQRPGSAKGVTFITLEDETGVINLVVWPDLKEKQRKVVMGARLMEVRGRVEYDDEVIHVIAAHMTDATARLHALSDDLLEAPLARADEVNRPMPERGPPLPRDLIDELAPRPNVTGHPRDHRILPKSRDFH